MTKFLIICAICVCVGALIDELFRHLQGACGVLKIDSSDPKKDRYLLQLDNLDDLRTRKIVILKVEKNVDLSQK